MIYAILATLYLLSAVSFLSTRRAPVRGRFTQVWQRCNRVKCQVGDCLTMADFIRGAANFAFGGSSRSSTSSTKDKDKDKEKSTASEKAEKEKLHASPSIGSDDNNGDQGLEEFDPFTPAEQDDVEDGLNNVSIVAPPEKE